MSEVTQEIAAPEVVKPNDYITIKVNKEDREVFMSGGLIRNLVPYFMDLQSVAEIFGQPILQNEVIIQALKPRTPRGTPVADPTIDEFEMTQDESNKFIAWITEHVLHYFIGSVTTAQELGQRNEPAFLKLMKSMESLTGSPASPPLNQ